jgi:hypothetical protein
LRHVKRIHLFEFEDFPWFPGWLRDCMTRYIAAFHVAFGTKTLIAGLVARALAHSPERRVLDLCSGGSGPMLDVVRALETEHGDKDVSLTLSDLYPNRFQAAYINGLGNPRIRYALEPIDAANVPEGECGVRTMICSLHHMRPETARRILRDAQQRKQPFVAFELSDNGPPVALFWLAIPFAFIMTFFITPLVRPMTWQQLVFTYLVPVIPLFIAWDGAVSNARTYTVGDMEELVAPLRADGYRWEIGTFEGRGGRKAWLLGLPATAR